MPGEKQEITLKNNNRKLEIISRCNKTNLLVYVVLCSTGKDQSKRCTLCAHHFNKCKPVWCIFAIYSISQKQILLLQRYDFVGVVNFTGVPT